MKPPDSSASPFPVANPAQSEIRSVLRNTRQIEYRLSSVSLEQPNFLLALQRLQGT